MDSLHNALVQLKPKINLNQWQNDYGHNHKIANTHQYWWHAHDSHYFQHCQWELIFIRFLNILIFLRIGLIIYSMSSFIILLFSWRYVHIVALCMNMNESTYNSLFVKGIYGIMEFLIELFWEVIFFTIF
jgi:hypothetical protein